MMADWTRRLQGPCPLPARLNAAALEQAISVTRVAARRLRRPATLGTMSPARCPNHPPHAPTARLCAADSRRALKRQPVGALFQSPCPYSDAEGLAHTAMPRARYADQYEVTSSSTRHEAEGEVR